MSASRPWSRRSRSRTAVVVALTAVVSGAGLAVAAPSARAAGPRTVVRVDGPVVRGAGGVLTSVATCPAGTVPIGVSGLASSNARLTRLGVGTRFGVGARSVVAHARPLGADAGEYATQATALCLQRPAGYRVVKVRRAMTPAQRQAALAENRPVRLRATANCPAGTHVMGTAWSTTRSGLSALEPAADGTRARAVVDPRTTTPAAVTAAAVCVADSFRGPDLVRAPAPVPVQDAGGFVRARATCPDGQAVSGGTVHRRSGSVSLRLNTFQISGPTLTVVADGLPADDTVRPWVLCLS